MSSNAKQAGDARKAALRAMGKGAASAALLVAAALGVAGCEATIQPRPVAVQYEDNGLMVRAQFVPRNIYAFPHVAYGGTYAYLVDGRWYYPTPDGWMILRREPVELSRQRTLMAPGRTRTPYGYGFER